MPLVQIGGENITVAGTAIGPTTGQVTDEVVMAEFQHKSGGALFCQTQATPTASGTNGDIEQRAGSRWRVWGHDDLQNFLMIRDSNLSAEVAVQYFGTGKT